MNKKILVVDDDPGIVEVIKIVLEDKGYEVITLNDGRGVYEKIKRDLPKLLLIDLWMSGMDGHEVTKILRKDNQTKGIPVIAISALSNGEKIAKESGVDDFLSKPFDIDDLTTLVAKYIS